MMNVEIDNTTNIRVCLRCGRIYCTCMPPVVIKDNGEWQIETVYLNGQELRKAEKQTGIKQAE